MMSSVQFGSPLITSCVGSLNQLPLTAPPTVLTCPVVLISEGLITPFDKLRTDTGEACDVPVFVSCVLGEGLTSAGG